MNSLTDQDIKTILQIQNILKSLEIEKKLLTTLEDLRSLLQSLESVENSWKDAFEAKINFLEMMENSIQDGSIARWQGDYKEDRYEALEILKTMSNSILEHYLKISDPNVSDHVIKEDVSWLICPKCHHAWESRSKEAMIICPECKSCLHNAVLN